MISILSKVLSKEELNLMRRKLEETMKENLRLNAENIQLRENLKEYQRNLDNCELNQEAQKVRNY